MGAADVVDNHAVSGGLANASAVADATSTAVRQLSDPELLQQLAHSWYYAGYYQGIAAAKHQQ